MGDTPASDDGVAHGWQQSVLHVMEELRRHGVPLSMAESPTEPRPASSPTPPPRPSWRCSESALKRPCSTTLIVTWYTAIRRPSPRRQCPRNCSIIAPAVGRSPSSHAATSRRTSAATSRRASTPLYSLGRDAPDRPLRRQDSNLDHRNQNPAGPVCSGRRRFLTSGYVFGTHCGGVSRLVTVAVNSRCQGLSGTVQAQPRSRWMAEQSPWTVPSSHDETTTETTL